MNRQEDVADFFEFLESYGFDIAWFEQVSSNTQDQRDFPGAVQVRVSGSDIQGVGVFSTADFGPCEVVAPAAVGGKRTPAGRFTNHAKNPNAAMRMLDSGDIDLTATQPIRAGEEVTVNYRQVMGLR